MSVISASHNAFGAGATKYLLLLPEIPDAFAAGGTSGAGTAGPYVDNSVRHSR